VEASGGGVAGREMNLRYAGICSACGGEIPRGLRALYSPGDRSARHLSCPGLDRGTAGGSARREFDRRKDRDDARVEAEKQNIRATFGDGLIGRVATLLAVDDSPRRSTSVWRQGAVGEERVAARLDALERVGVQALHDRRIPGTRANIDHLAITPWGVWVIDAKRYLRQKPAFYTEGGFFGFGGTNRLTVGGRKQDKLVDGVLRQIERVRLPSAESCASWRRTGRWSGAISACAAYVSCGPDVWPRSSSGRRRRSSTRSRSAALWRRSSRPPEPLRTKTEEGRA
jgi:hypothetical protein